MTKQLIVTCVVILAASTGGSPSAAQTPTTRPPGPLDNLVPTPNPVNSPLQVDAAGPGAWRRAMREKYEGKFPGPAPRTPDGKPDLNGVWVAEATPERPVMTPSALMVLEDRFKNNLKDYPYSFCLPPQPTPGAGLWLVMQNRTHFVTVFELPPNYRQVFLDGRPHPPDLDPTWTGHSIGTWDGDTLVVDSTGFNDRTWFNPALPHTTKLHITERWTRTTMGSMTVELVHEDPETFEKPWKVVFTLFLAPGEDLVENICENNKFPELSRGQNP
jgi:hypothetical protein